MHRRVLLKCSAGQHTQAAPVSCHGGGSRSSIRLRTVVAVVIRGGVLLCEAPGVVEHMLAKRLALLLCKVPELDGAPLARCGLPRAPLVVAERDG